MSLPSLPGPALCGRIVDNLLFNADTCSGDASGGRGQFRVGHDLRPELGQASDDAVWERTAEPEIGRASCRETV